MTADKQSAERLARKSRTAKGLALIIEDACREFELLLEIQRGNIWLMSAKGSETNSETFMIMALAKSFVFNAARAVRICEEGAGLLDTPKEERAAFVNGLEKLRIVRNVNEHGYDPKDNSRKPNARPSQHIHELESASLDETSLIAFGDEKILMGPIDLIDAYKLVKRMQSVAGYATLSQEDHGLT